MWTQGVFLECVGHLQQRCSQQSEVQQVYPQGAAMSRQENPSGGSLQAKAIKSASS